MTVIDKKVNSLTIDDIADKPAFFLIHDLMKFSPEWEYNTAALALANKLAKSNLK
ncbi:hypothetical protein [Dendronalium sp. ChiSLP03b]|uniref:hypothetical protein n=1 Tax=Dendronalium sp. ChiSLP03b TaxID=3075381 RepID=UPI002AD40082|nr:hypothetical protein [Dendronalium sp. ChiSLP03b]MDZ8208274.1 hypothetical protein [Dendronalium sp. ChiSLP03b]